MKKEINVYATDLKISPTNRTECDLSFTADPDDILTAIGPEKVQEWLAEQGEEVDDDE